MSVDTAAVYRAKVVDDRDPDRRGRLRLQIPDIFGEGVSGWCDPVVPHYWFRLIRGHSLDPSNVVEEAVPKPGDVVWAMFEAGDPDRPVWIGTWRMSQGEDASGTHLSARVQIGPGTQFATGYDPSVKARTLFASEAPDPNEEDLKEGDFWINTADDYSVYVWEGNEWILASADANSLLDATTHMRVPGPIIGVGGGYLTSAYGLRIETRNAVHIGWAKVLADAAGPLVVELRDWTNGNEQVETREFDLEEGTNEINLNLFIPNAGTWYLGRVGTGVGLWRHTEVGEFPAGSWKVLGGGQPGGSTNTGWYYFYNLEVAGSGVLGTPPAWAFGDTTEIDGGAIRTNTITANTIDANWISGDNLFIDGTAVFGSGYDPTTKVTTFRQTTTPTATATGDLWIHSTTGEVRRWSGSSWVSTGMSADQLESNLGINGGTVIHGGNIQTGTITVGWNNLDGGNSTQDFTMSTSSNGTISSWNFNGNLSNVVEDPGTTGWAITGNGRAVFNDVVVRNSLVAGGTVSGATVEGGTVRSPNYHFSSRTGFTMFSSGNVRLFGNVIIGGGGSNLRLVGEVGDPVETTMNSQALRVIDTSKSNAVLAMGEEAPDLGNGFGMCVGRANGSHHRYYENYVVVRNAIGRYGYLRAQQAWLWGNTSDDPVMRINRGSLIEGSSSTTEYARMEPTDGTQRHFNIVCHQDSSFTFQNTGTRIKMLGGSAQTVQIRNPADNGDRDFRAREISESSSTMYHKMNFEEEATALQKVRETPIRRYNRKNYTEPEYMMEQKARVGPMVEEAPEEMIVGHPKLVAALKKKALRETRIAGQKVKMYDSDLAVPDEETDHIEEVYFTGAVLAQQRLELREEAIRKEKETEEKIQRLEEDANALDTPSKNPNPTPEQKELARQYREERVTLLEAMKAGLPERHALTQFDEENKEILQEYYELRDNEPGINLNSSIGLLWKAVQELCERVDALTPPEENTGVTK